MADESADYDTIAALCLPGAGHGGTEKARFDFEPFTPQETDNPLRAEKLHSRAAILKERRELYRRGLAAAAAGPVPNRLFDQCARPPGQQLSI